MNTSDNIQVALYIGALIALAPIFIERRMITKILCGSSEDNLLGGAFGKTIDENTRSVGRVGNVPVR